MLKTREGTTLQRLGEGNFQLDPVNLLWRPVLVPQMAGRGDPPVTMNWSKSHLWSVASGWASTMSSMSSLGSAGWGGSGAVGIKRRVVGYLNWIRMGKEFHEWIRFKCCTGFESAQVLDCEKCKWMLSFFLFLYKLTSVVVKRFPDSKLRVSGVCASPQLADIRACLIYSELTRSNAETL